VHTKIIEADFTNDSYDMYYAIEKELFGLEIGVLINNVGMCYPHPAYFLELPNRDKMYSDIIKCNISSVTNMALMILPQMVERKKGVVVNVSSTAAIISSPLLTVYASSKVSLYVGNVGQVSENRGGEDSVILDVCVGGGGVLGVFGNKKKPG